MRRRKKAEAEKNMEKDRRGVSGKLFLAEGLILLLGAGGMWFFGTLKQMEPDRLLGAVVMTVLGLAVTGFGFRREYLRGELDYDNGGHFLRFWLCMGVGLAVSFACGFLPVAGWPFLVVFVMLALFANMQIGILSASILLMMAVLLSGSGVEGFALYLISGAFAVTLFRRLESDFGFAIPLFLSCLCLLVCETACLVLPANARPEFELFVIPVVNMIVSAILLTGLLKLFSSAVVYRYRERYLDINDTENPMLTSLREMDRQAYRLSIHTAYFCERIGAKLGLDVDALKCAGYYHKMGEDLPGLMEEKKFPPAARKILEEYLSRREKVTRKETAVLICSDLVVASVSYLLEKQPGGKVDFGRAIDAIFSKLWEDKAFCCCNLTFSEFYAMQRIFKEEELYYDFLR